LQVAPDLNAQHRPVAVLGHERDVQDPDDAAVHQVQQERLDLARSGWPARPLQDHIVDRTHLVQLCFGHDPLLVVRRDASGSLLDRERPGITRLG
jgi:hypothetical protein